MTGSVPEKPSIAQYRVEIVVALIAATAVVGAAVVTGGFGLLSGSHSASSSAHGNVSANGGSSRNDASCVSGGVVVQGTVNCTPVAKQPSGQLRVISAPADPGRFLTSRSRRTSGCRRRTLAGRNSMIKAAWTSHAALFKVTLISAELRRQPDVRRERDVKNARISRDDLHP